MDIEWKDEILYKDLVKWGDRLKKEAPFFKQILEEYESDKSEVLDVSCGTGFHLIMLNKWGFNGIGIDISELNIAEANKLAKENSVEHKSKFVLGDILEIESAITDRNFDFIFCIGNTLSIFNLEERDSIIQQFINLLKPGGKILLQVVNYLSHSEDGEWFYNPSLKRSSDDSLNFNIRMMEWKEKNQKVTMYVHKIIQASKDSDDFELVKKRTEFFVLRKDDFEKLSQTDNLTITFLGDYNWNEFKENKSNDLVVIIEKNN